MLLSVIMPMYNAAPFIRRSIGSLCATPVREMEIICINDGSTDNTADVVAELAAADARIRVIHQANGGVSSARNAGIESARGEYLCFVDADDSVEPHYLPDLLEAAQAHPAADCTIAGYTRVENGAATANSICTRTALVEDLAPFAATITVWGKLYKTRKLQESGVRFAEDVKYGEDTLFNQMFFSLCEHLLLCPACGYMYHDCAGSLSARRAELVTGMAAATEHLAEHLAAHQQPRYGKDYLAAYAAHALRRIRSMAPHGAQRACTEQVRTALQRLGLTTENLPASLSPKNRRLLQKILSGGSGLGPGYYWKRLSHFVKQWIKK